jgi:RNA polymerase sigma-70 factor (ECF subfamily)
MSGVESCWETESGATAVMRGFDAPPLAGRTAADLVAAHLDGDPRAFRELVGRYRDRLVGFVSRTIGDRERAEDLVQEAFLRVYRHLHRFDPARKFSTWLYTIASNLAKNELRNRRRSPLVPYGALQPHDGPDPQPLQFEAAGTRPDEMYASRYLHEAVTAAVACLSPSHREVFVLREIEGRSYEEIARLTASNLGTVKSRLNRARRAFAERIAPYLD